jgi:hypothetical protein
VVSKRQKRINAELSNNVPSGRIRSNAGEAVLDSLLRFSFKFYDGNHYRFHCNGRHADYFVTLIERLKDLSRERVDVLTGTRNRTTRFHPIDWTDKRVCATGFGIPQGEEYDDEAWQFSLTKSEHGRVHGFLVGALFYVVWFDADHQLYPCNPTDN